MTVYKTFFIVSALFNPIAQASFLDGYFTAPGLNVNVRKLTYFQATKPSDITKQLAVYSDVPERVFENQLRIDMDYQNDYFNIGLKPRGQFSFQSWNTGPLAGNDDTGSDFYFYEWWVRLSSNDAFSVEYALQNLQWGPSFLVSPSNPFDSRNGKDNPIQELPKAAYYAKAIWAPSTAWTVSGIANTSKGNKEYDRDFAPTYALKSDFIGSDLYGSLILSYGVQKRCSRLGFFGNYTLSDRWLAYIEGAMTKGDPEVLLGSAYTTDSGPTVGLEYFYNGGGVSSPDISYLIRGGGSKVDWREAFLLKNYVLLQVYDKNVVGNLDYLLRFVFSPNDDSKAINLQLNWGLTESMNLFGIGTASIGDKNTEFGVRGAYQFMLGIELFL